MGEQILDIKMVISAEAVASIKGWRKNGFTSKGESWVENLKALTHDGHKARRADLDIAKGIGAILVVWAHAEGILSGYIEQFHMPLFFFISGILFSGDRIAIKNYTAKKVKAYLAPFWKWNLIFFPLFFVLYYWRTWNVNLALKWLVEILSTMNKVPFLGATWFLPSLFWTVIFYRLIYELLKKTPGRDLICLGIGIAILLLGFYIDLPYRQSRTLVCSFFFVAGYLYEKYIANWLKEKTWLAMAALIFFIFEAKHNSVYLGGVLCE